MFEAVTASLARQVAVQARPLRESSFARFYTAQCFSFIGDAMLMATLPLALLHYGYSKGAFGFILTATGSARVAGLFLGGALADRFRRDVLLIISDLVCGAAQLTIVVLLVSGERSIVAIVGLYVLFGIGTAIFMPASQGLIAEVTSEDSRVAANGLLALTENLATVVVPAGAAGLVVIFGSAVGIVVDGASFLLSAGLLITLRSIRVKAETEESARPELPAGAMKIVFRTGWLRNGILSAAAVNCLGFAPFLVLTPIVLSRLHESDAWGLVLAAQAAGAIAGAGLAARLYRGRPLLWGFAFCTTWALLVIAIATHLPLVLIGLLSAAGGASASFVDVIWNSAIQNHLPTNQIGKVFAASESGSLALQPVSCAVFGVLAATSSASTVLLFCAGSLMVILLLSCASRGIRGFTVSPTAVPLRAG
jgi:hypothetical protein